MLSFNMGSVLLTAQRMYQINARALVGSLERLSTGQRINRGSDDPAGLIASEGLRASLKGLEAEARALQRSDHVANVAEGGLAVTSDMLIEAQGLVVSAANSGGMSDEERQAIQMQLDSTLAAIDRTATDTSFNGDKLLDGTATITAGSTSLDIASSATGDLGETDIDGTTYTLADLGSGGDLNLVDGDLDAAQQVIRNALTDVVSERGRIGAFQRSTINTRLNAVGIAIENTAAANSLIRDTNYAQEAVTFNRAQLLHQASLQTIGIMASGQSTLLSLFG
jgi:flagellin